MASLIQVDCNELQEFTKRIKAITKPQKGIKEALLVVAEQYLRDVTNRTPVKTGDLKRQWAKDNKNLSARIVEGNGGYWIEIYNTTEYAAWVENGHRIMNEKGGKVYGWCQGRFFVRATNNLYMNGKLNKFVTREFAKWLNNLFEGGGQ